MTKPPNAARKGLAFRWIAVVFVILLGLGLTLGLVVYRRYVAYEPVAARHLPSDAFGRARFDLTHVMLYEPFRRSIFPLVDALPEATAAAGRRERLKMRGIEVVGQVREVAVAFGPGVDDWLVVLGGTLPRTQIAERLAEVLREEGFELSAAERGFSLGGSGAVAFAQAEDGAFVLASTAERLRAALPSRPSPVELDGGAGGLVLRESLLPPSLASLHASFRAGSPVAVAIRARPSPGAERAAAEAALAELLRRVGGGAPHVTRAVVQAPLRRTASEVEVDLLLPREAMEELAAQVANRLQGR